MLLRVVKCFTDKTIKSGRNARFVGEIFEAADKRAKELIKHGVVEEYVEEPEPDPDTPDTPDEGGQAGAPDPDEGGQNN